MQFFPPPWWSWASPDAAKPSVAEALAARIGGRLIQGDAFHLPTSPRCAPQTSPPRRPVWLAGTPAVELADQRGRRRASRCSPARPSSAATGASCASRAGPLFVLPNLSRAGGSRARSPTGPATSCPSAWWTVQFAALQSPAGEAGVVSVDARPSSLASSWPGNSAAGLTRLRQRQEACDAPASLMHIRV